MPNFSILTHKNEFDCNQEIRSVESMFGSNYKLTAKPQLLTKTKSKSKY